MKIINSKIMQPLLLLFLSSIFFIGCQNIEPTATTSEVSVHTDQVDFKKTNPEIRAYDEKMISSIQSRWSDILNSRRFTIDKNGKVVVKFKLHSNGEISDAKIVEEFDELLAFFCLQAIKDCAPFPKWPEEMRQSLKQDYREINFTFYYGTNQVHGINK